MTKKKAASPRKTAPKGTAGGVKKNELSAIRKMLEAKRAEIEHLMHKNQEMEPVSQEVGDEADQAGQSLEKELIFEVSDNERLALDQIEGALRKMDKGTYGLCESCQKPIPRIRLKAVPFARYCINCQASAERAVAT